VSPRAPLFQGEDGDYYYILDSGHTDVYIKKGDDPEVKVSARSGHASNALFECSFDLAVRLAPACVKGFRILGGRCLRRACAAARRAPPGDGPVHGKCLIAVVAIDTPLSHCHTQFSTGLGSNSRSG